MDRLEDLENGSRRCNLRIHNLPEGSDDGQDPTNFISKLLKDVMGEGTFPSPTELERAHRTVEPKPPQQEGHCGPSFLDFIITRRKKLLVDGPGSMK